MLRTLAGRRRHGSTVRRTRAAVEVRGSGERQLADGTEDIPGGLEFTVLHAAFDVWNTMLMSPLSSQECNDLAPATDLFAASCRGPGQRFE
jgi:hypothetical protein